MMDVDREKSEKLHVLHRTHPLIQEVFRATATPPEHVKANRRTSRTQCTTCFTARHKLQTCQRCKSVWYCSKECQKKDWPRHKAWCTSSERPKGIKKLVENLVCNAMLVQMLQVCAALDLNLVHDRKKEVGFEFPYMIRVDLALEPADICSLIKLLLTDEPVAEAVEGMVQINRFHSHLPGRGGFIPLTPVRDTMWRSERERLNNDPVHRNNPLGLIEFVNNDSDFSITVPLSVTAESMKQARKRAPFVMMNWNTGTMFEKPMTVKTCMEFINVHIRSDKENQLKLRVEMTETDKEIIRSARSAESATRDSAIFLREKMARETIYAKLPLRL